MGAIVRRSIHKVRCADLIQEVHDLLCSLTAADAGGGGWNGWWRWVGVPLRWRLNYKASKVALVQWTTATRDDHFSLRARLRIWFSVVVGPVYTHTTPWHKQTQTQRQTKTQTHTQTHTPRHDTDRHTTPCHMTTVTTQTLRLTLTLVKKKDKCCGTESTVSKPHHPLTRVRVRLTEWTVSIDSVCRRQSFRRTCSSFWRPVYKTIWAV